MAPITIVYWRAMRLRALPATNQGKRSQVATALWEGVGAGRRFRGNTKERSL